MSFYKLITSSSQLKDLALDVRDNEKNVIFFIGEIIGSISICVNLASKTSSELYIGGFLRGDSDLRIKYDVIQNENDSHSIYKSNFCLDDNSQKHSSLTIHFESGSSGSKGEEFDNTTLLSSSSRNTCMPSIFCNEEKVHGVHNMSTGHIDPETADYLKSRGFSLSSIKEIIAMSSLSEIINQIDDESVIKCIYKELNYGRN